MPASSVRAGFDYQDLIAMREIINLLQMPDEIEAIELEANDVGALDDVRVRYRSGIDRRMQVKFAVDDGDEWTWANLLARPRPRSQPLLYKWFDSMSDDLPPNAVGEIVTNRGAAPDLRSSLGAEGQLLPDRLPQAIKDGLIARYGTEERVVEISGRLRFRLEQASMRDLEEQVTLGFSRVSDAAHYAAFKNQVRAWGHQQSHRHGAKVVNLDEARRASGFYELVPLSEELSVPPDFVVPDLDFDARILSALSGSTPSLTILEGDAGAGKSTFISDLYRRLRTNQRAVLRHHFWLSTVDPTPDRVSFEAIAATLMSQLNEGSMRDLLGGHASESPEPQRLGSWLQAVGANAASRGDSLILLLDGLDHALVPENRSETNRVLAELVAPRPGVKVLIATRPTDYPVAVREREYERIPFPRLQRTSLAELLRNHSTELDLPPAIPNEWSNQDTFDSIVDALLERTAGLALHVRIAIRRLAEIERRLTVEDVTALPIALAEGAAAFYERAWSDLRHDSHLVLQMLAAHRLPWHRGDLQSVLRYLGMNLADAGASVDRVMYLLDKAGDGARSLHYSLFRFVVGRPEYADQRPELDSAMRRYLASSDAPEQWRWGYLLELELQSPNARDHISAIDRHWFADAISRGRSPSDVRRIAIAAIRAALRERDLLGFVTVGTLYDYYASAHDSNAESFVSLEAAALCELAVGRSQHMRPSSYSTSTLSTLVVELVSRGHNAAALPFYEELQRRARDAMSREHIGEDIFQSFLAPELEAGGALGRDSTRVADLIAANVDNTYASRTADAYTSAASRAGQFAACNPPLEAALGTAASESACKAFVEGLLYRSGQLPNGIAQLLNRDSPSVRFLLAAHNQEFLVARDYAALPGLGNETTFSPNRADRAWREALQDLFADALSSTSKTFDRLLALAMLRPSMREFADLLTSVWQVCRAAADHRPLSVHDVLETLGSRLRTVPHNHDYREGESIRGFRAAIVGLILDSASIAILQPIDADGIHAMLAAGMSLAAIADALETRPRSATRSAIQVVMTERLREADESLEGRGTRAEMYLSAMKLSLLLNQHEDTKRCATSIGETLIALDWHKDMYLNSAIEAVSAAFASDPTSALRLLKDLATPVAGVLDFTDGDHTRYFPGALGDALLTVDEESYRTYYQWLVNSEDLFTVERLRRDALRTSTDTSEAIALLRTVRDLETVQAAAESQPPSDLGHTASSLLSEPDSDRSASSGRATNEHGSANAGDRERLPPTDFPPERLAQIGRDDWFRIDFEAWARYWLTTTVSDLAFDALKAIATREHYALPMPALHQIVLDLRGPADAYDILVRGITWTDWSDFNPAAQDRLMQAVRTSHTDRAYHFVFDTMMVEYERVGRSRPYPSGMSGALVRYLTEMGHIEEARALTERMVQLAQQLTAAWRLPRPDWLEA